MLSAMGLALGVDYALFIVSRFREERARGLEKIEAIAATGRTANRAVFFSGTAFVIALTGMLLVPDTILRSLAAGAVLVGITAVLAATTLLPAVLSLLGDRVDALRLPFGGRPDEGGPLLGSGGDAGATAAAGQPARVGRAPRRSRLARPRASHRLGGRPDDSGRLHVEGRLQRARAGDRRRHGRLGRDRRRRRHERGARARGGRDAPHSARERFGLPLARRDDRSERRPCRRGGARRRRQPRRGGGAGGRAAAGGDRARGARRRGRRDLRHRRDRRDRRLQRVDERLDARSSSCSCSGSASSC